jgi:Ca2+-binding RTX toxin-like protein
MMLSLPLSGPGPGSGWSFYSSYAESETLHPSSAISVAQAGGSNNGIPLCTTANSGLVEENGIPLCTTANSGLVEENGIKSCNEEDRIELKENMIRGSGCIVGTNDKDFIQALPTGDVDNIIFGRDKPDIIFSDVGVDTVYGGSGGDTVQGGPGNDQLFGESGDDHLFGGSDDDLIVGGSGNNHLFGDIGNDVLKGGKDSGANYFDCGEGIDIIIDFNPAKGDVTAGNCEIF